MSYFTTANQNKIKDQPTTFKTGLLMWSVFPRF